MPLPPDICKCSLSSPPRDFLFICLFTFHHYIYVSMCVHVYVLMCLCAYISFPSRVCLRHNYWYFTPWIFSLMYCCCVSIIFVNCIFPPGALIWLINLFLFLFLFTKAHILFCSPCSRYTLVWLVGLLNSWTPGRRPVWPPSQWACLCGTLSLSYIKMYVIYMTIN